MKSLWERSRRPGNCGKAASRSLAISVPIWLAVAAVGTAAEPQTTPIQLKVGDLDAGRLKPYVSAWRVIDISPGGTRKESQRSFDQLALEDLNGRRIWRQHQYDLAAGQPAGSFDGRSDARTFAPIDALERGPEGAYRSLRYEPSTVHLECRGSRCPPDIRDGEVHRRDLPTPAPTFDYWGGTYGLLLALVPLKPGTSYLVPVLHPARGLIQLQVDVERRERIKAANGAEILAYRVRTPLTGWVYHVTEDAPYWVRLEYSRPDGSSQITERLDSKPHDPRSHG
jgi:hypothetical protein